MTMGLNDNDVAFFLAADTRELYQEVNIIQTSGYNQRHCFSRSSLRLACICATYSTRPDVLTVA